MSKVYDTTKLPKQHSFWKFLWVRIVGKRWVSISNGYKIVSYYYKGKAYITSMEKEDE